MSRSHAPPAWINAYDGGVEYWPPYWDRALLRRILFSPDACHRFDEISEHFGANVAQEVLEICLSMRATWEAAPKITKTNRDRAIRRIQGLTSDLLVAIQHNEDALRAYRALPLSLPFIFPERPELLGHVNDETAPISVVDVLIRFHESLGKACPWEDSLLVPSKPAHINAFRTYTTQNLIRLLRTRTGRPMHSVVADLVNIVVDDPDQLLDPTHVAKLDPGAEASAG